jgi:hypothetical protein
VGAFWANTGSANKDIATIALIVELRMVLSLCGLKNVGSRESQSPGTNAQ